ncbi:MAG: hypothetical protein WDW38_002313 [Sanguina aurantia]
MPKHAPPAKLHTPGTAESCPLCVEDMDPTDLSFLPCPCGYRVCLFCFQKLKALCSSKCPNCRRIYGTEDAAEPEKTAESLQAAVTADTASSRPPPARPAPSPSISPAPPAGHYNAVNTHNPYLNNTTTTAASIRPVPMQQAKPPLPPAAPRKPEPLAYAAVPVSKRPGDAQQQDISQQLHGLPSGSTWASSSPMRHQAAESPVAAAPVALPTPPVPSLPSASVVDDNAWPSLSDSSTAYSAPPGKPKAEQEPGTGRQGNKIPLGSWDRAGSGAALDQMSADPLLNQDQLLHLQAQYHPLGGGGGGSSTQPQSRFMGQGQQQQAATPTTSYLPLGQPAGGVLEQFGGPRQHRSTNGHAATPAAALAPPQDPTLMVSFNVFLDQAPPAKPPLAPAQPATDPLELAALVKQKERANGKAPMSLMASGKPPPGFAGPTGAGSGGSSNGPSSPRGGFQGPSGSSQPSMTPLLQQQQQQSVGPTPPLLPSRLLGPHISPLHNEDNPVIAGPFVARCRPISPPMSSGTAYGSHAKASPPLSTASSASSAALRPQLWSGLPGIDLGPYLPQAHLWQNAYQQTTYRPLIQQQQPQPQQQQAPPVQQQQQYQPLLQAHLQQQQLLQQQQQQQGGGLAQLDAQLGSYPLVTAASAKTPPPGFGPPGGGWRRGRRSRQAAPQRATAPQLQPQQHAQQQPQQQMPVHQAPGYRPQLSPA